MIILIGKKFLNPPPQLGPFSAHSFLFSLPRARAVQPKPAQVKCSVLFSANRKSLICLPGHCSSSTSSSRSETEWARFFPSKSDLFSCVFLKLVEGKLSRPYPLPFPQEIPKSLYGNSFQFRGSNPSFFRRTLPNPSPIPSVPEPISPSSGYK